MPHVVMKGELSYRDENMFISAVTLGILPWHQLTFSAPRLGAHTLLHIAEENIVITLLCLSGADHDSTFFAWIFSVSWSVAVLMGGPRPPSGPPKGRFTVAAAELAHAIVTSK